MTTYTISKKRIAYITDKFFQWSFCGREAPTKEEFLRLDHPADLYYLVHIYNWDDGELALGWVLDSPLCTRSTVNLLFWRAAPDFYLDYDLEDPLGYDDAGFRILRRINQKYKDQDFSTYQIHFDPEPELETITTEDPKWTYPVGVYDKINGVQLLCEE